MDTWEPYLHWAFREERVLVPSIHLHSFSSFLAASTLAACVCVMERCLSRLLEKDWHLPPIRRSRWQRALWRAFYYWTVTFLRLCYMLVAMTFHIGLILVMVTSLTITQTTLELLDFPPRQRNDHEPIDSGDAEPLLERRPIATRPRSKSKPDDIFIHPAHSNLARADALAFEMGISGDAERVQVNRYDREEAAWNVGEGKDAARALLGSSRKASEHPFHSRLGL